MTASSHGCDPILDPLYVPKSQYEREVFVKMQKFMYNVFVSALRTTMGRHFVQRHDQTGDAQAVWCDYVRYMRTSTKANMELEELLSLITSS